MYILNQKMNNYEKWNNLVKWITNNHGSVDGITMNNERKILATKQLTNNHQIMKIPDKLHINGGIFNQKTSNMVATMAHLLLELEKGNKSFYYPYLSILPNDFDNHPLNIINNKNIETFIKLSPDFVHYIIEMKKSFTSCSKELKLLGFKNDNTFMFCFLIIQTRAWITNDTVSLIPCMDLLEHRNFKSNLGLMKKHNFIMTTNDKYEIDEEVYDNYGFKDNISLLAQYNFLADNPILPVDLSSTPSLNQQLLEIRKDCHSYPFFDLDGPNHCLILSFNLLGLDYKEILSESYDKIKTLNLEKEERDDDLIIMLKKALKQKKEILEKMI